MDKLPQLLGRPYSLEDEEDPPPAAAADAMDAEGPGAASSSGGYTTEQLLERVQASRAELLVELQRLSAVQLSGVWRLVDEAYLGALLEMLVMSALEKGWSMDSIPLQEAITALQPDGYHPAITQHCLEVYGNPCSSSSSSRSQQQQQQQADLTADPSSSGGSSSHYSLDETRVCLHYARKLLSQRDVWYRGDFLAAWVDAVPSCFQPREDMLAGEVLLQLPEGAGGEGEPRLRHFPARALPAAPGPRFAALFAAQPRWTREQLDPYLAGLQVPGQTVEQLLLKYARASQRSPSDPTLVFVAR